MDRDFETHLQDLFDAPTALDDQEQFARLIERDIQRMRRTTVWVCALAAAGAAAGLYLAFDPLWSRWSNDAVNWATQASAATPYASTLTTGAAVFVAAIAVTIGLITGRKA